MLVYIVPFRHPLQIAKTFASLDFISNGRIIMGAGLGWNPKEFESLSVSMADRGSRFEEVDQVKRGENHGWPIVEGPDHRGEFTDPVYAYDHSQGCAITGGTFYAPASAQFPSAYVGTYFFADYCGNWINRLDPANGYAVSTFATGITAPVDLRVAGDGSLYFLARGTGSSTGVLGRIAYTASGAPTISQQPAGLTVSSGAPATFSVTASGTEPLDDPSVDPAACVAAAAKPDADDRIIALVREHFDLRPKGIVQMLDLLRPIYEKTAAYGHFGRNEPEFTWEATDRVQVLRDAAGLKG